MQLFQQRSHSLIMLCSTSGTIHATYACIERSSETPPEVFHTRQLSYPLMVTVYHMLDCQAMDILPLPLHDDDSRPGKSQLPKSDIPGWCLFSIEVRNSYGTPFEVTIERVQQGIFLLMGSRLMTH